MHLPPILNIINNQHKGKVEGGRTMKSSELFSHIESETDKTIQCMIIDYSSSLKKSKRTIAIYNLTFTTDNTNVARQALSHSVEI